MFEMDLEKAGEPEIKLPTSVGSWKKQESSRKISSSASLTTLKPLTVRMTTNCGKFFKRQKYQPPLPASWETRVQVKKQQNWTWNNRLVPNRKRSMSRLYSITLLIWLLCRVHHAKCWAGWSTNWNQDCQEKLSIPSGKQMTPPLWQKAKKY